MGIQPREQSQQRIQQVLGFMRAPNTPQVLRRSCLALRLTGAITSFTARKDTAVPMLVQLAQGQGHELVGQSSRGALGSLRRDGGLDVAAATGALLATAMGLHARLGP